jgi:SSS family solute:Na+ symporter
MLTCVDYVVIVLYFVLTAALGFIAKGMIHGLEDYFAAGRKVPWWVAALSHHVSGYSAFAFVGYAAVAYNVGFNVWTLFALPCFIGVTIGAFVWAPRWARLKVLSPVEYLERRFNNLVRQIIAWSGILIKFVDEGLKLYALAVAVTVCTNLPLDVTILACGLVAMLYLMVGGLWAEIMTDVAQFVVQFSITLFLVPVVLHAVGGWSQMWAQLPPERYTFFSDRFNLPYLLVFGVVITMSYNGGSWGLAQRYYALGKPRDAQKAALLSALLYLLYPLAIYIPVWAAPQVLGSVKEPQEAYVLMAQHFLPGILPGLLGLFIAAMFAATMSMVDSDINALAAVFTKDIYSRTINPRAAEGVLMRVGLIATAVFSMVTIACGLIPAHSEGAEKAFNVMVNWYAALLAPVAIPLLFGMLYRRATWRGALAAWVGGFATFVLAKYILAPLVLPWDLTQSPGKEWAWTFYTGAELIVAFGLFFLEGLISRQTPEEQERVDELFAQLAGREQR